MTGRDADAFEVAFRRHALAFEGFAGARAVVVGASGGLDSMTLLHLLRHCDSLPRGARLHAAHFDHAMRPESADDAQWVAGVCREWGVTSHVGRAPSPVRTEAEGRALRYQFLEATRRSLAVAEAVVATAHTADDQAETVLFRIARGSGPSGLAGVRPWRAPGVARPLLPFWRKDVRAYARSRRVPFRDDPSNLDSRWVRNRLRRTILPALEEAVPGASAALAAHARSSRLQARALEELLDERVARLAVPAGDAPVPPAGDADPRPACADPAAATGAATGPVPHPRPPVSSLSLDRDALLLLSGALLPLVLRHAAACAGSNLGRGATDALVRFARQSRSGKRIDLPGGVVAELALGRLHFLAARTPVPAPAGPPPSAAGAGAPHVEVDSPAGEASYAHAGIRVDVAWGPSRLPTFRHVARFGGGGPPAPLVVRPWRPGDRVAMPYGKKKVKKLLLEARVPRRDRAAAPVVAVPGGPVLWAPGAMAPPRAPAPPAGAVVYLHVRASTLPAHPPTA